MELRGRKCARHGWFFHIWSKDVKRSRPVLARPVLDGAPRGSMKAKSFHSGPSATVAGFCAARAWARAGGQSDGWKNGARREPIHLAFRDAAPASTYEYFACWSFSSHALLAAPPQRRSRRRTGNVTPMGDTRGGIIVSGGLLEPFHAMRKAATPRARRGDRRQTLPLERRLRL